MKRWALAVVVTSLLALGACDSGGGDNNKSSSNNSQAGDAAPGAQSKPTKVPDPHFALFPDKVPGTGWEMGESVRELGTGRSAQLGGLPGIDWYTEFSGPQTDEGDDAYLSLTGYTQSLEERKGESFSDAATPTDGEINGHTAFWGVDEDGAAVVTWQVTDDYTIEVYATGLTLDETLAMARTVKDATQNEWVAAGGKLSDCSDGSKCPDSADG